MSNADIEALKAQMRAAQVFGKGQYFEKGQYTLEVDKLFYKRTLVEGVAKENIICEFKVLSSSNPTVETGETRSTVFAFHHKGWLPRFKALLIALAGVDPDGRVPPETESLVMDLYVALRSDEERKRMKLPENFLKGRRVRAEAFPGKSQRGVDVTNMKWSPIGEEQSAA